MVKQRLIKSGLAVFFLCGLAQATVALSAPVAPLADAPLAPAGPWTVGSISAKTADGQKFCSMKNKYPARQSLVFASDNMGSSSIALDLHKDLFQAGQRYDVKALAGSVTRGFDVLASTKQVLVMQTGIDPELYSELARSHNVTFTVDKNSYSFELDVSAADALVALDHCSESLQVGPAFAEAKFPLGKVHEESLTELAEAVNELPAPQPAPKKHHKHKPAAVAQEQPQLQVEVIDTTAEAPAPTQADTARDDMKAEIASEILNLRASEEPPQPVAAADHGVTPSVSTSAIAAPAIAALPVTPVEKSSLPAAKKEIVSKPAAAPDKLAAKSADEKVIAAKVIVENAALKSKLAQLEQQQAALLANVNRLRSLSSNDSKGLADAQAEIAKLKQSMTETPVTPVASKPAATNGDEKVIAENTALKSNLAQLEQQQAALLSNVDRLKSLSGNDDKALADTQAEIASLKQSMAGLQTKLAEKSAQTASTQSQLNTIRDDMKAEMAARTREIKEAAAAPAPIPRVDNLDLRNLLQSSHVLSAGQQVKVGDNGNTLRWTSGGLFGSAQQRPQASDKSLTDTANDYLQKTASLCKGDFAQKLGQPRTAGKLNVLEADITCLDGQNTAAAAVLFVGNRDMFSVITEEGTIDQLPTAMLNRDAIISTAQGNITNSTTGNNKRHHIPLIVTDDAATSVE